MRFSRFIFVDFFPPMQSPRHILGTGQFLQHCRTLGVDVNPIHRKKLLSPESETLLKIIEMMGQKLRNKEMILVTR